MDEPDLLRRDGDFVPKHNKQKKIANVWGSLGQAHKNYIQHNVNRDHQIVSFLIYTKPLITLAIFILCYTKPDLLLSQLLRLAIAHHI